MSETIPPLADAPEWFRDALAVPFSDERLEVEGAAIHYLAWGQPGRRGLVFVHGGGAHAHWWTHVAARFASEYRVVALDLSGHGDSGHRGRVRARDLDPGGGGRLPGRGHRRAARGGGPQHGRVRHHRHRRAARRRTWPA